MLPAEFALEIDLILFDWNASAPTFTSTSNSSLLQIGVHVHRIQWHTVRALPQSVDRQPSDL